VKITAKHHLFMIYYLFCFVFKTILQYPQIQTVPKILDSPDSFMFGLKETEKNLLIIDDKSVT